MYFLQGSKTVSSFKAFDPSIKQFQIPSGNILHIPSPTLDIFCLHQELEPEAAK